MLSENAQRATLTPIASFPRQYFLENLTIRDDSSILVTVANHKELWYIPPSRANVPVSPLLLCTFPQSAMGIVEVEHNIFYVCTSNLWTSHESCLRRLDLRDWTPGKSVNPEVVLKFTEHVRGLNGCCLIASNIILIADCFANLIWRVDLPRNGGKATARVWLKHDSMATIPMVRCPTAPESPP